MEYWKYENKQYMWEKISIKMLKDVGMTVPKSGETSAVNMQQHRRWGQYICSKTGDEL